MGGSVDVGALAWGDVTLVEEHESATAGFDFSHARNVGWTFRRANVGLRSGAEALSFLACEKILDIVGSNHWCSDDTQCWVCGCSLRATMDCVLFSHAGN